MVRRGLSTQEKSTVSSTVMHGGGHHPDHIAFAHREVPVMASRRRCSIDARTLSQRLGQ